MIRFFCPCGAELFFESEFCGACKSPVAYNPEAMRFEIVQPPDETAANTTKTAVLCRNGIDFNVCNWLADHDAPHGLCFSCQFNRTIPNLGRDKNIQRWHTIEKSKRRLLFSLQSLGIPLANGWRDPQRGLLFDFLEDARSNPMAESPFVTTGYLDGVVTINVLEADPALRFAEQQASNQEYRTVLGHFRHESGHHAYQLFAHDNELISSFAELFGDAHRDYGLALQSFHTMGPRDGWEQHHITAYASAHPSEDWAETWGHYLHIHDTLETAASFGLLESDSTRPDFATKIHTWRRLSVGFNELNRSMGLDDAYPFIVNSAVAAKLAFVDHVIGALRNSSPDLATALPPF